MDWIGNVFLFLIIIVWGFDWNNGFCCFFGDKIWLMLLKFVMDIDGIFVGVDENGKDVVGVFVDGDMSLSFFVILFFFV